MPSFQLLPPVQPVGTSFEDIAKAVVAAAEKALQLIGPYGKEELYHKVIQSVMQSDYAQLQLDYKKAVHWQVCSDVIVKLVPDLVVQGTVVELKVVDKVGESVAWQVRRYMQALNKTSGLIINVQGKESRIQCYSVTENSCRLVSPS